MTALVAGPGEPFRVLADEDDGPGERLPAALRWVYAHLPAPLAAPLPTGPATPPLPVPAASR